MCLESQFIIYTEEIPGNLAAGTKITEDKAGETTD